MNDSRQRLEEVVCAVLLENEGSADNAPAVVEALIASGFVKMDCTCPAGFFQVADPKCPIHGPSAKHTITGVDIRQRDAVDEELQADGSSLGIAPDLQPCPRVGGRTAAMIDIALDNVEKAGGTINMPVLPGTVDEMVGKVLRRATERGLLVEVCRAAKAVHISPPTREASKSGLAVEIRAFVELLREEHRLQPGQYLSEEMMGLLVRAAEAVESLGDIITAAEYYIDVVPPGRARDEILRTKLGQVARDAKRFMEAGRGDDQLRR